MSKTGAKSTVSRLFDAINHHDPHAIALLYNTNAIAVDPMYPEPLKGSDAIAKEYGEVFTALPDLALTLKQTLIDGADYSIEFTMRGTHKGPLIGPAGVIPPTNKRIDVPMSAFGRIDEQSRIIDERRHYDVATMLRQLGLME